ncbi:lebercilin-like [Photinus pyralis]|uniref:lebercilin-like n=1 Tax=Photinus pyralis TaxID=7054 RepID=UPI00126724A1|nr:lebercilin-like [Photinus pyralis]
MANSASASSNEKSLQRRKSCDTVCSSNSSCLMQKRKQVHPLAASLVTYAPRNTSVQQRVLSARLLKLRSLQNKLNDANFHVAELQQENRALRNLQSRQDKALSRYEGTNADLPRLLKSYEEDIRVLATKNKALRKTIKDVSDQLKTKDEELANVRMQLRSLTVLTKNKHLGERQMLTDQVEDLKEKLKGSDEQINLLNRKILLESKNYKTKLNAEVMKSKQRQKELSHALSEIDRLNGLLEGSSKHGTVTEIKDHKRFSSNNRQTVSLTNLINDRMKPKLNSLMKEKLKDFENGDESELKLEPIATTETKVTFSSEVTMVSPSENIRARLSANLGKEIDHLSKSVEELSLPDEDNHFLTVKRKLSGSKLEKFPSSDIFDKKFDEVKKEQDINKRLGNCCTDIRSTVVDCSAVVKKHQEDYAQVHNETEKLLRDLHETDVLNSKLRCSKFLNADKIEIPEKDFEIANEIWENEYSFRTELIKQNGDGDGKSQSELGDDIGADKKNKLLATLRAIDNNNEIDEYSFPSPSSKSHKFSDDYFDSLK